MCFKITNIALPLHRAGTLDDCLLHVSKLDQLTSFFPFHSVQTTSSFGLCLTCTALLIIPSCILCCPQAFPLACNGLSHHLLAAPTSPMYLGISLPDIILRSLCSRPFAINVTLSSSDRALGSLLDFLFTTPPPSTFRFSKDYLGILLWFFS